MTKTTTSGFRRANSSVARGGQSKNSGFDNPLETCDSYTGATTPVAAAGFPSPFPNVDASESPAIQSRSGASAVSGARHAWLGAVVPVAAGTSVAGGVV